MNARLFSASVAVIMAATATSAYAQDNFARNRNTSVRERPRPDYEALGIGQGGIRVLPQASVTVTHDSNIYATATNPVDDSIVSLSADVAVVSDWNVHAIGAEAHVQHDAYTDNDTENSTTYGAAVDGRLDATRNLQFTGAARYDHYVEARTASGNPTDSVEPIDFAATGVEAGALVTFNQLRVRGTISQRDLDFDDGRTASGVIVDQSYRDEKVLRGTLRADYAISPDTSLFIEGAVDKREFDTTGTSLVIRDSDGREVTAGADFDITALIRGSVQAGYLEHDFDDPSIDDTSGFSGRVRVEYFPSELATITVQASRSVEDTGLRSTSGFLSSNYSAQVDYEFRRNIILTGRLAYGDDEYQGLSRDDERFGGTLSGVWLVDRRWGVGASYNYYKQESSGLNAGTDFEVHRVSASLTLQY